MLLTEKDVLKQKLNRLDRKNATHLAFGISFLKLRGFCENVLDG